MSIIRTHELYLTEIIQESNLVIEVKLSGTYKEEVNISRKNSSESFPPFIKTGNIFKVVGVLKNTASIKVPDQLKVPDENWRRSLQEHKQKYLHDPEKSYTINEYSTTVKSIAKATIIFLHHFQDMFEFTARNAFEDNDGLEKVQMLIKGE